MNTIDWNTRLAEFNAAQKTAPSKKSVSPKAENQKAQASDWEALLNAKRSEMFGETSVRPKPRVSQVESPKIQNQWAMQGYVKSRSDVDFNTDSPKNSDNSKRVLGTYLDLVV